MARRRLVLMRHGKTSWSTEGADIARPLSTRGRRDAQAVAARLASVDALRPQLLVGSPARRSAETVDAIVRAVPTARLATLTTLYEDPADRILADLRKLPENAALVCVVGHLPALLDLVRACAEPADSPAWDAVEEQFPTCAFAVVDVAETWASLGDGQAQLVRFEAPGQVPPRR